MATTIPSMIPGSGRNAHELVVSAISFQEKVGIPVKGRLVVALSPPNIGDLNQTFQIRLSCFLPNSVLCCSKDTQRSSELGSTLSGLEISVSSS